MATLNKATLIGHLGHDPELRYLANGDTVAHIALATTETWKDKATGQKKEATEWHRVVLYRKLGEIAGQYLKKGSLVYIEGRLQTRKWANKDGIERHITEIIADDMKMLGARPAGQDAGNEPHSGIESNAPTSAEDDSMQAPAASERQRAQSNHNQDAIPF